MRTMRRICRKRMLRSADVAKILPCVPAAMTATEATNTMKSAGARAAMSPPVPRSPPAPHRYRGRRVESSQVGSGAGRAGLVTDDTEGLSGKAEAALPSSVTAAAASGPDPDDVLQAEHHDHHEFL